jgi:RNA polymerase sigma-70 factor (ECF subfamily)
MMDPSRERLDDFTLLRATGRDPESFAVFYRRHERLVVGYLMRHTRRADLVADLTAEVFAAALVAAPRFRRGPEPASAWLVAIAHNKLVSSMRRRQVEARARQRLGIGPIALPDETMCRLEEAMVDADFSLDAILASLPPDQAQAIRAHVVDELSYETIAERLSCSKSVVRQRVSRGLASLRARLEENQT